MRESGPIFPRIGYIGLRGVPQETPVVTDHGSDGDASSGTKRLTVLLLDISQRGGRPLRGDIDELRAILAAVANPEQQERIAEAIDWAEFYLDPSGLELHSEERLRMNFHQAVYKAVHAGG